jgi:hypothetical protein
MNANNSRIQARKALPFSVVYSSTGVDYRYTGKGQSQILRPLSYIENRNTERAV